MGIYDSIVLVQGCHEHDRKPGAVLETKSLYAGGGEFIITAAGELIEHCYRLEMVSGANRSKAQPQYKRVSLGDRVIDYHGDLLLHYGDRTFVVRFTHGRLEWFRPAHEYPEASRAILLEQGAR
jgi:hypothetical protein